MSAFSLGPALLFCPADRPDRFEKAAERADAVILDLEDAVAPPDRQGARVALRERPLHPDRTIVRVNPAGTPDHDQDVAALREAGYRMVMVAKTGSADDLGSLDGLDVIALCETARGIANAREIAEADGVVALMWGAEDLFASLGGSSSRFPDGRYRDAAVHARSTVLVAAAAAGRAAIDTVHLDIEDTTGLAAEAADAAASGFIASACIHPSQVQVIRQSYAPTPAEVEFARDVLEAARTQGGVFSFRGRMVDEPVLALARRVLARA